MKKLALIAALLGLTSQVQSSEIVTFTASCKTIQQNKQFLEGEYNEIPLAGGPSVVRSVSGQFLNGTGKIYVDPEDKGFTVVIEFKNIDKTCVLMMGDEFAPIHTGDNV